MTDKELRGIILAWFYEKRREGNIVPKPENFSPPIHPDDLYRICDQLAEHNFLEWTPQTSSRSGTLKTVLGHGRISANGVDIVESGGKSSPIAINFQNISITQSQGVQIGNGNIQSLVYIFENLISQIESLNATEAEKMEVKSRLKSFLEHPLVNTMIGAAAAALMAKL